ncbi:MAG: RdgB/HAM1 family non-canonical purine NTP pyrophosphatase [Candidatus Krumholzibacteriota bacterium]|nr:RdgB/HAM1 family non-canonical purine NTP pyrophosphatase [Candidatus Krumholzibacteriota bacterium]
MGLKIVLATRNRGKIREIRKIISDIDVELLGLDEFPPFPQPEENGATFLENALLKAKAAHRVTGLPTLSDDSGLEVEALGGGPGVFSARYGGSSLSDGDRYRKLLEELEGVPEEKRGARFRCVMVIYPRPGKKTGALITEGILEGRISIKPAGRSGFGYDPVFLVPEAGKTAAQMSLEEKNRISHRYRALVEMKALLIREYGLSLKERKEQV